MSMTPEQELVALRQAVRMMGLDPAKLADLADNAAGDPHPHILLGFVGLEEAKLRQRFGADDKAIALWQKAWARLASEPKA